MILGSGWVVNCKVSTDAIALFLASATQSEPITWATLFARLKQLLPIPWLWIGLPLIAMAFLVLIDIGDKLSGILGWLGIESPWGRTQLSPEKLKEARYQLLRIIRKELDTRLATSLHELVKLDLYMEDQRQKVGLPKIDLVPEDPTEAKLPNFQISANRILHPKDKEEAPLELKLTQKIIEVFDRPDINGKLLILGNPGSGKTTELLQLAKDLVIRASKDKVYPVPVLLELSSWDRETIDNWVASQLRKLYNISEAITKQWLESHQLLLLLDGLDELGLEKQKQCILALNQFLSTTHTTDLVVCCRREEYEAGEIELYTLNVAVYLEPLKKHQIRQYFIQLNRMSVWEIVSSQPNLIELSKTPLFLFMMVFSYQDEPIYSEQELFDAYIDRQLYRPRTQDAYFLKPKNINQTCYYLGWLARQLESIGEVEFLIEELQPHWLPSIKQRVIYYLLFGLVFGLPFGVLFGLSGVVYGLFFGLFFGVSVVGLSGNDILPEEILTWSFSKGFRIGLRVGLTFGIFFGLIYGIANGLLNGLLFGLLYGLVVGSFFGLPYGLMRKPIQARKLPNQSIREITHNTIIFIIFCMLIGGLLFGLNGNLLVGLIVGLMFGLLGGLFGSWAGGLNIGPVPVIQHLILRILLTKYGYTPWNYARFLEHAVKHRFIQRTGGRYRFVHDLLRKHFAAMPLE